MQKLDHLVAAVVDTHVWIWIAAGDARAGALGNFTGRLVLPAICLWEAAMLSMKGRVTFEPDIETWVRENSRPPASVEPLSAEIALESCRLTDFHGEPADRIVVATAIVLGIPLITADQRIVEWNHATRAIKIFDPSTGS